MELSQYIKIYNCESKPGCFIIFSTKNSSKILINNETLDAIKNNTLSADDTLILSSLEIIVPDKEQEINDQLNFFDKLNKKSTILHITIILNLDCNFDCPYCYEQKKGNIYMSKQTAYGIIEFIEQRLTGNKKYLILNFTGGEPLLSIEMIRYISGTLKKHVENRGGRLTSYIVTNGSLLTRPIAQVLSVSSVENAKITIDGPADTHNMSRPYRSGRGSFDTIIKNIKDTCGILKISIGGNYSQRNYHKFSKLIGILKTEGITPDKLNMIRFSPVLGIKNHSAITSGCISINEPWVADADILLREEILKQKYRTTKTGPISCMVDLDDALVINHNGELYKCPGLIGFDEFKIGSVKSGIQDYSESHRIGLFRNDRCRTCAYLPMCWGGCRCMSVIKTGAVKLDCKKQYLDSVLETMVKQDLEHGLS